MTAPSHPLLGTSPPMRELQTEIEMAARSDVKVLVTGETGVGKEVVARAVHRGSRRSAAPFITINCVGVPDSPLESDFFGQTRGRSAGAFRNTPGLLRQADRGTVFLDEVGEMSLRAQSLLLRSLETGEIQTVGTDVRIVAATSRDLFASVNAREFRGDLYYRLNVLHLIVPPLRERSTDIPILLHHYLRLFAEQHHVPTPALSAAALERLAAYEWPGNVRELKNVVEHLVLRETRAAITVGDLSLEIAAPPPLFGSACRVKGNVSYPVTDSRRCIPSRRRHHDVPFIEGV